jgi:hypothetical protein
MKKQIVTIVLGAAVMMGTVTSLFAQTSGVAVGGGAAGGPNGIYKDPYGLQRQQCVQYHGATKAALRHLRTRSSMFE